MRGVLAILLAIIAPPPGPPSGFADYDRLGKDNVTVRVAVAKNAGDNYRADKNQDVVFDLEIGPVGSGDPATLEFYAVRQFSSGDPEFRFIERIDLPKGGGKLTVVARRGSVQPMKGWLLRVVRGGRVIGYAGSLPRYEEMAQKPAMLDAVRSGLVNKK